MLLCTAHARLGWRWWRWWRCWWWWLGGGAMVHQQDAKQTSSREDAACT